MDVARGAQSVPRSSAPGLTRAVCAPHRAALFAKTIFSVLPSSRVWMKPSSTEATRPALTRAQPLVTNTQGQLEAQPAWTPAPEPVLAPAGPAGSSVRPHPPHQAPSPHALGREWKQPLPGPRACAPRLSPVRGAAANGTAQPLKRVIRAIHTVTHCAPAPATCFQNIPPLHGAPQSLQW